MSNPAAQLVAAFPSDLKLSNRMQILDIFKSGGTFTVNQISQQTGVSRQTVTKAIQFFMQKGLIVSTGKTDAAYTGGKRAELFSLSPEKYLLSVCLWPDTIRLSLLNFQSQSVDKLEVKMSLPATPDAAMQTIGQLAGRLLSHHTIDPAQLCGVSVSTSGIVDYHTNTLKFNSLSPSWGSDIPVAELLQPYFAPGTPILVENVAKVVGRSILHNPEYQDKRVLAVFSSWGGICACFIDHDRILNGVNSLIGEIGHMVLDPDSTVTCGCGNYGCFERLASTEQLRAYVAGTISQHPDSILNHLSVPELHISDIFSASALADPYAQSISARLGQCFALALRNITLCFDPEVVVFHGDFAAADDHFRQTIMQKLAASRYYPKAGPFTLQFDPRPIQELNTRGACTMLLDHIFSDASVYA